MKDKNKGVAKWNKTMRPSAKDCKAFRESKNWVEHKDAFLVTTDAQNLNHLVDSGCVLVDLRT